jgi:hypothetical protein
MSRARLRELVVLFAISSALTLAVFFLALWLLPFETFTPFPFPRFPALFNSDEIEPIHKEVLEFDRSPDGTLRLRFRDRA